MHLPLKTPLSHFLPVSQSGSSFNVQSQQLFKISTEQKKNKKQLSHEVPRDKYYQMRSMGSNTCVSLGVLDVKMCFSGKILLELLFALAVENCLRKLEQRVHSSIST